MDKSIELKCCIYCIFGLVGCFAQFLSLFVRWMLISLQESGGYLRGFPQTANKLVSSQWEGLDSIQGYIGREGAETGIQGPHLLVADFGGVLQFPSVK